MSSSPLEVAHFCLIYDRDQMAMSKMSVLAFVKGPSFESLWVTSSMECRFNSDVRKF